MLTALIVVLAATATASSIHFDSMQVSDWRIPRVQHNISFTFEAPDLSEDNANITAGCTFGWINYTAPTNCWKACKTWTFNETHTNTSDSAFFARLIAYTSSSRFSFNLWRSYHDDDGAEKHNNASVEVITGHDGYYCSNGLQTSQCSLGINSPGIDVPEEAGLDGLEPDDLPLCE